VPLVAGVTIRIRNIGTASVRARGPGFYAVLELLDDTGASPIARTSGPCDGQFATTSLRIAPGAAVQGCLPYEYTVYGPPIQFLFGLSKRGTHGWRLPH
jgi:hypothetical protein